MLGDFNTGDIDNPMAAFSSLPHVPGHEVVAEVVALGREARGLDVGQRVVLNPWLTCAPRGIEPLCPPCQAGDLSLCWSFTKGDLGPGVHVGVITGAPGAWAEQLAAHDSMLIPVPDGISDEAAVLADPFSVSFHAIVRHPPPASGRVLVYGAGALGLTSVAILKALYPGVEVGVVARFEAQRAMAVRFGADAVFSHEPRLQLVDGPARRQQAFRVRGLEVAAVRDMSQVLQRLHGRGADLRAGGVIAGVDGVQRDLQAVGHLGSLPRRPGRARLRDVVLAVGQEDQDLALLRLGGAKAVQGHRQCVAQVRF